MPDIISAFLLELDLKKSRRMYLLIAGRLQHVASLGSVWSAGHFLFSFTDDEQLHRAGPRCYLHVELSFAHLFSFWFGAIMSPDPISFTTEFHELSAWNE